MLSALFYHPTLTKNEIFKNLILNIFSILHVLYVIIAKTSVLYKTLELISHTNKHPAELYLEKSSLRTLDSILQSYQHKKKWVSRLGQRM